MHYRDDARYYSLESIVNDARYSIDTLHDVYEYLIFCRGDGRLVPESEGVYTKRGDFYSHAYEVARMELEEGRVDK